MIPAPLLSGKCDISGHSFQRKMYILIFKKLFFINVAKNVTLVGYYGRNNGENFGISITNLKENKTMSDPHKASTDLALRMKQSFRE